MDKRLGHQLGLEFAAKIVVIALILWQIHRFIDVHEWRAATSACGETLVYVGLLMVGVMVGFFRVSYSAAEIRNWKMRIAGHVITGLWILSVCVLMEIALRSMLDRNGFPVLSVAAAMICTLLSLVFYDLWRLFRSAAQEAMTD
jgi:hypothetical protein